MCKKRKIDAMEKLDDVAFKLEAISGHLQMRTSLHQRVYKTLDDLGLLDKLGGDLEECETAEDYEILSCKIVNEEDELLENATI